MIWRALLDSAFFLIFSSGARRSKVPSVPGGWCQYPGYRGLQLRKGDVRERIFHGLLHLRLVLFLQRQEDGDGPVRLDLVDYRMVVGAHIDEVANVIALRIRHRRVVAGGDRLLSSDVGRFPDVGIVAQLGVVR